MKRKYLLLPVLILALLFSSCTGRYEKYQAVCVGLFDVDTQIMGYARSQAEFDKAAGAVEDLIRHHAQLFDIYNDYDGISNLKTINDSAGTQPVQVDPAILDLLELSVEAYDRTDGLVNVAMGAVLRIWHDYRVAGNADPDAAALPSMEELTAAQGHTNIQNMIVDRAAGTVYLTEPEMSLDVGSIAKGFTAQRAVEAAESAGMASVLINMGGNVVTGGKPMDGRDRWSVGIQDPGHSGAEGQQIVDVVFVNHMAVVSSGNYQRFYTVNGRSYNHIIDPITLLPPERYDQVTVLYPDSGWADILTTALFILPQQEGEKLLAEFAAEGMWVPRDGEAKSTPGFAAVSQNLSGYTAKD